MSFLLFSYLASEIMASFFASLLILSSTLFLGKLAPLFDVILEYGIGMADFVRLSAYFSAMILLFCIPMATMIGVNLAFTRLVHDREVMAFMSSGVGLSRLLFPVVVIAFVASAACALFSTYLVPISHSATKKIFFHLAKERIEQGLDAKSFSRDIKEVVIYVDHFDKDTKKMSGVFIVDNREKDNPMTVVAQQGELMTSLSEMRLTLTLKQGSLHRAANKTAQTIRFELYSLILPLEIPGYVAGVGTVQVGRKDMMTGDLLTEIKKVGSETPAGASLLVEFHKRLVFPVGCLILGLLGIPLAFQTGFASRALGTIIGLLLFILYYFLTATAKVLGENGTAPVTLVMWTPNLIFTVLTIILLFRSARIGALPTSDSPVVLLPWIRSLLFTWRKKTD